MTIGVLALPSPLPMWSPGKGGEWARHEPLLKGREKLEAHQDAPSHQDVVGRGIDILHNAANHKLTAVRAARKLHNRLQDVHRTLDKTHFKDKKDASSHEDFKSAATHLDDLTHSLKSMHREVEDHVKTKRKGGNQKTQEETTKAESLGVGLTKAKTWGLHHGEDPLKEVEKSIEERFPIPARHPDDLFTAHPYGPPESEYKARLKASHARMDAMKKKEIDKYERVQALNREEKEVLEVLKNNPRPEPPAQSVLAGAKEKLSSLIWSGSSQQRR